MKMNKLTHPLVKTPQPGRSATPARLPQAPQAPKAAAPPPTPQASMAQSAINSMKQSTKLGQLAQFAADTNLRKPK